MFGRGGGGHIGWSKKNEFTPEHWFSKVGFCPRGPQDNFRGYLRLRLNNYIKMLFAFFIIIFKERICGVFYMVCIDTIAFKTNRMYLCILGI